MNDSSLSIADARALVASPLWPRIRAFLWDFASLCDPARLTAALSGGDDTLVTRLSSLVTAEGLLGSPRAARAAEKALGLSPFFHSFPASDGSRLLLLTRESYDRLAQFLGAVALAPALRRVTLGADVRALKSALPGVYPEALAFAPYFHRFERLFETVRRGPDSSGPAAVHAAGHTLLAIALFPLPAPLLLRQRLRFPAGSPADAALGHEASPDGLAPSSPPPSDSALAAALLALKLSNPTEYRTQCS